MRQDFLPFSRPSITAAELAAVREVLLSGWITTGPRVARLEDEFAAFTGSPGAVALASATAGMHLLLAALRIGPGDEVVTPSLTWVSTANLVVLAGATPVFVDVDRDDLMVRPEAVAAALTDKTRLVVPVHYAGAACDVGPIRELCAPRGIPVVEDAAHAAGTRYRGEPVGRRGTAIFSLHAIKNVTAAEGGVVCSDDADLLERIRRLRFHGLGVDAHDRNTQGRSPQAEVLEPGFKYNLSDLHAAVGLVQLGRIDEINARRRALAAHYRRRLADVPGILPLAVPADADSHAWHLFVVRVDETVTGLDRATFMARLKARNIGTGIHFRAIHEQAWYREHLPQPADALPATAWNSARICSLPLFPDMTEADVDDVVDAIEESLAEGRP